MQSRLVELAAVLKPWGFAPKATVEAPPWNPLRVPESPEERVLLSLTHHWLRQMPRRFHPRQLCRHYPWVANHLAHTWYDTPRAEAALTQVDHAGFGAAVEFGTAVADDLARLRMYMKWRAAGYGRVRVPARASF